MRAHNKRLPPDLALHLATFGVRRNADDTYSWKFDPYQRSMAPHRLLPDDHVSLWSRITCPTLLLHAEESFLKSSETAGLAGYFPKARSETISGAGHWLHHDKPDEVLGSHPGISRAERRRSLMPMHVVICGGGVIGACTAYFLARRGIDVTVVERAEVASSASGKAGGFLASRLVCGQSARCAGAAKLRASRELARGDRQLELSARVRIQRPRRSRGRQAPARCRWARLALRRRDHRGATEHDRNDRDGQSTLVHLGHDACGGAAWREVAPWRSHRRRPPRRDYCGCHARWRDDCGGCHRHRDGAVVSARRRPGSRCRWSSGLQSPSLVYDTGKDVPAEALYLEYSEDGAAVTVEVFPRADGSTHVCAFSGQGPLPMNPAEVKPDPRDIARLQALCERLSPAFRPDRIIARQACFRPVTQDGLPLIGKVPGQRGRLYRNRA